MRRRTAILDAAMPVAQSAGRYGLPDETHFPPPHAPALPGHRCQETPHRPEAQTGKPGRWMDADRLAPQRSQGRTDSQDSFVPRHQQPRSAADAHALRSASAVHRSRRAEST